MHSLTGGNVADLQHLVGQQLTDEVGVGLKLRYNRFRIKKPGMMYTQDFRPDRLNVHCTADGTITGFSFG